MFRTLLYSSALALAAVVVTAPTPAEAAQKCSCAKPKKAKKAKRVAVRKKIVRPRAVAPAPVEYAYRESDVVATYYTPHSGYLPDPWRTRPIWDVAADENSIADGLARSIDLFRSCGWKESERAEAVFVTWSRTHQLPDRARVGTMISAERAYTPISAYRLRSTDYPPDNDAMCQAANASYPDHKALMDSQADALEHAHTLIHR